MSDKPRCFSSEPGWHDYEAPLSPLIWMVVDPAEQIRHGIDYAKRTYGKIANDDKD